MGYQEELQEAMKRLEDMTIITVLVNPMNKTNMIIFKLEDNDLWLAEQNMKAIAGTVQEVGTGGHRLRMAAKMENGLTGLTITLSEQAVKDFDAAADVVDWAAIAEEYHVAKGLQ
jgi:ATP-dependent protease Clp ATPase subunit